MRGRSSVEEMRVVWGAILLGLSGCASDEKPAKIDHWEGYAIHLASSGMFNGEGVDFRLTNPSCTRLYDVPMYDGTYLYDRAVLMGFVIRGVATMGGVQREFALVIDEHDFTDATGGRELRIIPRNDLVPPTGDAMWFEWEWFDAGGRTVVERAAEDGSFTLTELSGTPDDNGMLTESTGNVAGFVNARWSETEGVAVSFTAPCTKNVTEQR